MNRPQLKKVSKKNLSRNIETVILCNLLYVVIVGGPTFVKNFYDTPYGFKVDGTMPINEILSSFWHQLISNVPLRNSLFFSSFIGLVLFLITPVLTLGLHYVHLRATGEEKPSFTEMFKKFDQFGSSLLMNILIGVFTFLQFLLLIIPGIIAIYSYSMAYFVLAEHPEFSAMQAIKESKRIMKGHRFELFVLQLSFFWWYLLVAVTFGLASIYVIPYTEIAKANFYNEIKNA